MSFNKKILTIILVWIINLSAHAATLSFIYAGDSDKPIPGVKLTQTESDGTVTIYASNAAGQITLTTTTNTYTLAASLAETGTDPISVQDALYILQHIVELRTLDTEQIKAADINSDGNITIQDALKVLQHNVELTTLNQSLIFYDANTSNLLSETTFNSGDTPSITVIRQGDTNLSFEPDSITDHAPILTGKTTLSINENDPAVGTLIGSDADGNTLTYSITGGADQDLFTINASTGVLSFNTAPDYEAPTDSGGDNLYDVEITISDGTTTTSQALVVSVGDLNDRGPVISNLASSVSIEENQTSVVTVSASDPDNDTLTYTLTGTDAASFSISSSGVITFDSAPDYETKTSYSITVNVSDGTNTTTQALTIAVTNVNDNDPAISSSASFSVAENQTSVGTVTAADADGDSLTYSLSGTDASRFNISSSGVITFGSAPDYETKVTYSITVSVDDGIYTDSQDLTINIINLNDNSPVISGLDPSVSVAEGQTAVVTISASDIDGDDLTYTLSGSQAIYFNISPSGVITFNSAPDYETDTSDVYDVIVEVSDGTYSTSQTLKIWVTNLNDHSPVLVVSATLSAHENQTAVGNGSLGSSVAATATDADGDSLIFSLSGTDASSLSIGPSSGVITFNSPPDYETDKSSYTVTVEVSDGVHISTQVVTITLYNLNDSPPVITSPDTFTVAENETTIASLTASDADGLSNAWQLSFTISGTDASSVSMISRTKLAFNTAPDFETKSSYSVIVTANDGSNSSAPQTITITITNVADHWVQRGADIDGEAANDYSGKSLSLSSDGDTVAIGAPSNDGSGSTSGHVRVYDWNGSVWVQRGTDIDGEASGDESGGSVSMSNDGNTVAIGAGLNDGDGTHSFNGHVRVYDWNGSVWVQRGTDIDGRTNRGGFSGGSVSLSGDGDTVAIGAPQDGGGRVHIYDWNGSAWVRRARWDTSLAGTDAFGMAVSLSNDGDTVLVGAPWSDGNGSNSGYAGIYAWMDRLGGSEEDEWVRLGSDLLFYDELINLHGETSGDHSGRGLSIVNTNGWGGTNGGYSVAIGAPGNDGNGSNSGHVRIYDWEVTSGWTQRGADIDGEAAGDHSGGDGTSEATLVYTGGAVSFSSDGSMVAIGASSNDANGDLSGHVRIYDWEVTSGWTQRGADIDGEAAGDYSGGAVSLSSDGETLAIGAIENDGNGSNSGHVRIYDWD